MVGKLASAAIALSILGVGTGAIVAPAASSGPYGLAVEDPTGLAFVRALGVRDVVFGLLALRFLARGENDAVTATMGIGSLIAVGDVACVYSVRGPGRHLAIHLAGWAGMVAAYVLARRETEA